MKKYLLSLVAVLILSAQAFAQVAPNFDIFILPYRFGDKSVAYFEGSGFKTKNIRIMTQGNIVYSDNHNKYDLSKVRNFIERFYPDANSNETLVLDWESGPFKSLRDYPESDSRFKTAEATLLGLMSDIKKMRPNLKLSYYTLPFRTWNDWQAANYNAPGKLDNIMSKMDFISPSLYLLFADEEVGRSRNMQYMKENLDMAMKYGQKYGKPVYPFLWHRVHFGSPLYGKDIIQKDVYTAYVKYMKDYSYNGVKLKGMYWWDGVEGRLENLGGIKNWLNGSVYNESTYDGMIVNMAKSIKSALNSGTTTEEPEPIAAPSTDTYKVTSFTLQDASTGKDIQTLSNGATLNLANLPSTKLNVRANASSGTGSVVFTLGGEQSKKSTESIAPFELMGDNGSWTPAVGSYTLKGTPYSGKSASGSAGTSLSLNFEVINSTSSSTENGTFTLVNADTDKDIQKLTSGATLNLAALPTKNLNIRYTPDSNAGSIVFSLSGEQTKSVTESGAPYTLAGDDNGNYYDWTPALGSYTLKATAYSENSGKGTAGASSTIKFSVVNNTSSSLGVTLASNAVAAEDQLATTADLSGDELTVYPVPATTVLYVDLGANAAEGTTTIQLSDLNGQVALTKEVNVSASGRHIELDVSELPEGLYSLTVTSSTGRVSKRVLIN
ncbi:T9SS type A sorting domain-containing protein [Pontibacter liquoris]|uniref:T9SS type A sorting domain-containing protein n=1 Tax=Pontibacter liquoris TaxID=2905677 RepID=UPI001FA77284|nr:T9SS type A sorting domain-containing protein [Pontibacter liquoris]